jgi:pimeloyl-ACP methyl ester carboxylesterase
MQEQLLYHKIYQHPSSQEWVVFVHGAGGSSSVWHKQIKAYKEHFNIVLVDLRGHGKSNNLLKAFKQVSQDVIEVIDALQIEKAHFIGISMGTIIIRTIGEIAPERVRSLIMAGAVIQLDIRSKFLVKVGNALKQVLPHIWLYKLFAFIIMPKKQHEESRSLFIREAHQLTKKEFMKWFKLTAELNPLLKYFRVQELKVPTLYVMGEEDYLFLAAVRKVVAGHSFSSLQVIANCGHVVNVQAPDQFNTLTIDYIKGV